MFARNSPQKLVVPDRALPYLWQASGRVSAANLNHNFGKMSRKPYDQGKTFLGRIEKDVDLLQIITRIVNEEAIFMGTVQVWGWVQKLSLSVFDQSTKTPQLIEREGGYEIAVLSGTVSQFKGRSMARLSGVFVARDGSTIGGTLSLGTMAYACEVAITKLEGGKLSRDFDTDTGLPLWKKDAIL